MDEYIIEPDDAINKTRILVMTLIIASALRKVFKKR